MATLVRWEPFREIAALQNDMGRLMSAFLGQANGETTGRTWVPAVDVWETEDKLVYAFDLPGIPEDKIAVEFDDGSLTVSGERERSEEVRASPRTTSTPTTAMGCSRSRSRSPRLPSRAASRLGAAATARRRSRASPSRPNSPQP